MKAKKTIICVIGIIVALTVALCFVLNSGILNPVEHQMKLASKYLQEGKYEEAVLAYTKAIEIDDKNVMLYEMLGAIYTEYIDEFSSEDLISLLKQGYEKTNDEKFIDLYIVFAENLISTEHYSEALELLQAGLTYTGSDKIKEKINYMYENDMMEDISETMNKNLLDDFSNLVAASSSSGMATISGKGLLEGYKYVSQSKRDLIYMFMSDYAGTYLKEKNAFKWNIENVDTDNDGYEDAVKVPAEQMDWVLKNYFNVDSAHDLTFIGTAGADTVYYSNGYYYSQLTGRGDMPPTALIEQVFSLGNNRYYFKYKKHWKADGIYSDEDFTSEETFYAVVQRKNIDGVEFWSFVDASEYKLNLIDYIK